MSIIDRGPLRARRRVPRPSVSASEVPCSPMNATPTPGALTPILMLPGYADSGPDHWQSHWERADRACRRVVQDDWLQPTRDAWLRALESAVAACGAPPVLVAHSLACSLVAHWAARAGARARGALLVAPADVDSPLHTPDEVRSFSPIPMAPLPFP